MREVCLCSVHALLSVVLVVGVQREATEDRDRKAGLEKGRSRERRRGKKVWVQGRGEVW